MLISAKPNVKVEKLFGVTADTFFTLPALHTLEALYVYNNGASTNSLELKHGATTIASTTTALGRWKNPDIQGDETMFNGDEVIDVISGSGWSGVNLDIYIVIIDLSV